MLATTTWAPLFSAYMDFISLFSNFVMLITRRKQQQQQQKQYAKNEIENSKKRNKREMSKTITSNFMWKDIRHF
jgi:hypothetical protein